MGSSDTYREFLEGFIEDDKTSIPEDPSDWARRPCLFFQKLLASSQDLAAPGPDEEEGEGQEEGLGPSGPRQRIGGWGPGAGRSTAAVPAPGSAGGAAAGADAGDAGDEDRYVIERELAQ